MGVLNRHAALKSMFVAAVAALATAPILLLLQFERIGWGALSLFYVLLLAYFVVWGIGLLKGHSDTRLSEYWMALFLAGAFWAVRLVWRSMYG